MAGFAPALQSGLKAGSDSPVRPADITDAVALAGLDKRVNPSPWSEQQFADACEGEWSRERILLVGSGDQIQGFVVYSQVLDEASIHNMAVKPCVQRRGLGELLLSTALTRVRDAGARRCFLELRASNEAAHGLYRKLGFHPDGLRKGYYQAASGREDAVLMSLTLCEQE
jgi:ribosomal-protein-alanine N-acetyltransferase